MKFNIGDKVKINLPDAPKNCPGKYHNLEGIIKGIDITDDKFSLYYNHPYHIPLMVNGQLEEYCHFSEEQITYDK